MFALVCVFAIQFAKADNDRIITFEQLPTAARSFIKEHFPQEKIAFVKEDKEWFDTSYEVTFVNGDDLEFRKNGEWKEIDCKRLGVPAAVVPVQIANFAKENYPDARILKLERDKYAYEVILSNYYELKFDLKFNLIDIDIDD